MVALALACVFHASQLSVYCASWKGVRVPARASAAEVECCVVFYISVNSCSCWQLAASSYLGAGAVLRLF